MPRKAARGDRELEQKAERTWHGPWEAERSGPLIEQREMTEMEILVRDCVEELPEPYQHTLLMYDYERLSYREMAARSAAAKDEAGLPVSPETMRRWHEEARERLRALIEERLR